jgi:hypothetical protein
VTLSGGTTVDEFWELRLLCHPDGMPVQATVRHIINGETTILSTQAAEPFMGWQETMTELLDRLAVQGSLW